MGRTKPVANFKPQAKTSHIARVFQDDLAPYEEMAAYEERVLGQAPYDRAQKVDAWSAKLRAEEQYLGGSFFGEVYFTHALPAVYSPGLCPFLGGGINYAGQDAAATDFLDGLFAELQRTDSIMLPASFTEDNIMDLDPAEEDFMAVDDAEQMEIDSLPAVDKALHTSPMEVLEVFPNNSPIMADRDDNLPVVYTPNVDEDEGNFFLASRQKYETALALIDDELAFGAELPKSIPPPLSPLALENDYVFDLGYDAEALSNSAGSLHHLAPNAVLVTPRIGTSLCTTEDLDWITEQLRRLRMNDGPITFEFSIEAPSAAISLLLEEDLLVSPSLLIDTAQPFHELLSLNSEDFLQIEALNPLHSTPISSKLSASSEIWEELASLDDAFPFSASNIPEEPIADADPSFITISSSFIHDCLECFELPCIEREVLPKIVASDAFVFGGAKTRESIKRKSISSQKVVNVSPRRKLQKIKPTTKAQGLSSHQQQRVKEKIHKPSRKDVGVMTVEQEVVRKAKKARQIHLGYIKRSDPPVDPKKPELVSSHFVSARAAPSRFIPYTKVVHDNFSSDSSFSSNSAGETDLSSTEEAPKKIANKQGNFGLNIPNYIRHAPFSPAKSVRSLSRSNQQTIPVSVSVPFSPSVCSPRQNLCKARKVSQRLNASDSQASIVGQIFETEKSMKRTIREKVFPGAFPIEEPISYANAPNVSLFGRFIQLLFGW